MAVLGLSTADHFLGMGWVIFICFFVSSLIFFGGGCAGIERGLMVMVVVVEEVVVVMVVVVLVEHSSRRCFDVCASQLFLSVLRLLLQGPHFSLGEIRARSNM